MQEVLVYTNQLEEMFHRKRVTKQGPRTLGVLLELTVL